MAVAVEANSPLAEQLTNIVQPKLVDMGWTTGGFDDSALTEYIILMLVNGKTQQQIAAELSNDLLNLGPEDAGANTFAQWLFDQVNALSSGAGGAPAIAENGLQANPELSVAAASDQAQLQGDGSGDPGAQDAGMGEAMDGVQGNIPTGPRSMRNGPRNGGPHARRILGQVNKAMDRSSDPMHRVRAQSGERINMHNRQPPKGPRGVLGQQRPQANGIPTGPVKPGAPNLRPGGPMSPEVLFRQQQQMLQMLQQMLPAGSNPFQMQGGPAPVINPNFQNGGRGRQPQGKSLFERIEGKPNRQTGPFHSRNQDAHRAPQDTDMSGDASMEVDNAPDSSNLSAEETVCKFNLKCTKSDCPFGHQSPAAPPGTTVDVADHCPFGAACQNRKCTARHPSPAQKKMHQSEQECKFFPNCTNARCPFRHPTMPLCRNGADCTREGCRFTHLRTACKFNPCLNPSCPYKHEEGQKRGKFGDMVWRADAQDQNCEKDEKEHVSERKFIADGEGPEELIVPGNQEGMGREASLDADITVS